MTPLARRASLVVVLLLLASVSTASAECAWLRWTNHWDGTGKERWVIGQAHASKAVCLADVARAREFDQKTADTAAAKKSNVTVLLREDGGTSIGASGETNGWRYHCLPDTIDPRGPKGK